MNKEFMDLAVSISIKNVDEGGGPFGAVIVKDNKVISMTGNSVTKDNDPTAHAEINAIRKACKELNTFDLSGCVLYSSCEPCPMCMSAINWSHIDTVYYANTKEDAESIGFDDNFIYEELKKEPKDRKIPFISVNKDYAITCFDKWTSKNDKIEY